MTNLLHKIAYSVFTRLLMLGLAIILITVLPQTANAGCIGCVCVDQQHQQTRQHITQQHDITRQFITDQFKFNESWIMNEFYVGFILPAMMMMTEQLVTNGMEQTMIIGTFFDAKHQLETQRLFQKKMAEAHKEYQPSLGMCSVGTVADSLAAAEQNGRVSAFVMNRQSIQRQLLDENMASSGGRVTDRASRMKQFIARYCDKYDNNNALEPVCGAAGAPAETRNKDIDYASLISQPLTINADYTDGTTDPNSSETDLFALSNNLFGHDVIRQLDEPLTVPKTAQEAYLDYRSIIAKRSVLQNSFYSVVGMKTSGTEESGQPGQTKEYGQIILEQLGMPKAEADKLLGDRPSYYALIQLIGKKIYQQPEFFTDLYDTPANVARKDVAMRAIDLMVDRNIYKSDLRSEAMLDVYLELQLMKMQRDVQNRSNKLSAVAGKKN